MQRGNKNKNSRGRGTVGGGLPSRGSYGSVRSRASYRKRRRRKLIAVTICIALTAAGGIAALAHFKPWKKNGGAQDGSGKNSGSVAAEKKSKSEKRKSALKQAKYLRSTYDYDAALEKLKDIEGYENDGEIAGLADEIKREKASCVPVDMDEVTHIFYHSLVVDEKRAFANQDRDSQAAGNNTWMTTVDEFNAITLEMYNRGFVFVSIHDMYEMTTDETGAEVIKPGVIMLPPGKKAVVLSLDDLSYYHGYAGYGFADRLIIDKDGDVVNEYTDEAGHKKVGAYDCVPLLDKFIKEHPDASYHGAKGIIALTGYNGILGYRTDDTYDLSNPDCDSHQEDWIKSHPGFSLKKERAEAKKVADAMKKNGWEFASHTWGHIKVGEKSLEVITRDTEKWKANVEPLVGPTDVIIFANGQTMSGPDAYTAADEKYMYFRSQGYRVFCNVDSAKHSTVFGRDFMRQGRRNLDGYRIYNNAVGNQDNLSDLFDAKTVLDPDRPPVPPL